MGFTIYLDESGTASLNSKLTRDSKDKYFCLNGIIINNDSYQNIMDSWERIRSIFVKAGYPKPYMHLNDIKNKNNNFGILKDSVVEKKFNDMYLNFLKETEITIVSVVIDKERHQKKYFNSWEVYGFALSVIMARYARFLADNNKSQGEVVIESRGNSYDKDLLSQFDKFYEQRYQDYRLDAMYKNLINKSIQIKTKDDYNVGLEISDMLANLMKHFILSEYGIIQLNKNHFNYKVVNIIKNKIRTSPQNIAQIKGYGILFLPS